jgi:hypothetical protein
MNTLVTDKKYTVILSAYLSNATELTNLINSARMHDRLEHHYHVHAIPAIGVYHSDAEQAYVIHTNSSHTVGDIKRLGLEVYKQECVLVSNNRKHDVQLHNSDCTTTHIGHGFKCRQNAPKGATSYTILNGCDYWSVK